MFQNENILADDNSPDLRTIFAEISAEDISAALDPLEKLSASLSLREVTTEELSLVLGLSDRRISQLWQDGHTPEPRREGKKYYYPLLASIRGYLDFLRS